MRSVVAKIGIRESMKVFLLHAPDDFVETITTMHLKIGQRLTGDFDYIHFFSKNKAELRKNFLRLKKRLRHTGMLWVSWKKNAKEETGLSLPKVIEIGYDNGLVESKTISIDKTWSAIKFTFPKAGKIYQNSDGKLKS